jgi:glycosidase
MPWAPGPGSGFTTADRPWLRFGPDVARRNVRAQAGDPDSVLAAYRRLIAARRATRVLQDGELTLLRASPADVLGYRRSSRATPHDEALVLVAFGPEPAEIELPRPRRGGGWQVLVGTQREPAGPAADERRLRLAPLEGVILVPRR